MPLPTGPQWSDFQPIEDQIPEGIGEVAKREAKEGTDVVLSVAKKGFKAASRGTQAATLATAAAGVIGAATGVLPADTGLLVAASSPVLPFARQGVEHLSAKVQDPDRMSLKRTLNPSRFVKGLLDPPGAPQRR